MAILMVCDAASLGTHIVPEDPTLADNPVTRYSKCAVQSGAMGLPSPLSPLHETTTQRLHITRFPGCLSEPDYGALFPTFSPNGMELVPKHLT